MLSVIALAVFSAITASAAPHGHNHFHLHAARSPRHLIDISPIAGRSDNGLPLDLMDGTCGGSTGFGCGDGFCCSKWGYCGVTEDYCGIGCQFGSCNGTATGPTNPPTSNATEPISAAAYSSTPEPVAYSGPVVTIQMTVTATGPSPVATVTSTSEAAPAATSSDESISAAGIASKVHGPPGYSQSWAPLSQSWGQPEWTPSSAVVPTTFATQTSAPAWSAPAWTPSFSSAAAPIESSAPAWSAPAYSAPAWTPSSSVAAPAETSAPAYSAPAWTPSSSAAAPAYTPASSASAPAYSAAPSSSSGGSGNGNTYKLYSGDGTAANGWPTESEWLSFDSMWEANLALIGINCDNSDDENSNLKSAISSISSSSGVPANYILAIIMQESKGCVRVVGTNNGVGNPGLMQSHNGQGSCNGGSGVLNPCPMSEITKMVSDGTEGTMYIGASGGDGLQQLLASDECTPDAKYYQAARLYNSGSMSNKLNLLFDATGTPCYTSDIANRLMGWTTATTQCNIPVGAYSG